MADQEQLDDFIEALEGLGGYTKNPELQTALGWPDEDYEAVKAQLVARRIVVRGKGRSDSVAMVGAEAPPKAATASKPRAKTMSSTKGSGPASAASIPLRRMTQAELDAFLENAADILRGNVDHSEFRGYVFALLFFKRISDIFEESVRNLAKTLGDELANDPAMQKKSLPFVVPADSLWEEVTLGSGENKVTSLKLGQSLNDAMLAIERANAPKFDGILTSKIDFNKTDELPRDKLVKLVGHFASRTFDRAHVPDDLFGDAYEYLIRTFASKAGKSSGEFYTPKEVSYLMSEIIEPQEQHEVCDWSSGSASLLLQCREYLRRHKKDPNRLFLFAQESNLATYNISRINMILHGINSWQPKHGDSLRDPQHKTSDGKLQQFDRVVMNPPFSLKDWGSDTFTDGDPFDRFGYGWPPQDNGDYAWMQHIAKSLKPAGKAVVVMSQGILFRGQPKLTESEDGRNKKADDEYLIRSGFLRDGLIEAVIVLPSGIFYGNNVPACLAILNKRKPAARKDQVLMIWASRHYQHANPQCLLRRADCLRILLPWRAFGDTAKALEILPAEGQTILDEIADDRAQALQEIGDAYDEVVASLPILREEADSLSPGGFKAWKANTDAAHPVWGELANPELDKAALKLLTKAAKDDAKARLKIAKAQIKTLEKLEKERDERIAEINSRADRETAEVQEAIADLQRICAHPDKARRYFVIAEKGEIEENEFNLNLPRYVDTFEPEEEIPLDTALHDFDAAKTAAEQARRTLAQLLGREF
ncbi:class I SAM-dependent DNA methyltransferase [Cyanobium sp. NS01]|uniref:type I restriction-modification system subunit M n=1 Tax=Cyanobium sp. NS01 TaxID=261284 RepID=UPI0016489498|nr:class I SAM-dependent DNA methyltransferase [Cyanobium sp. NS01]QNI70897.1 Putative Type I restriction-modification system M subunit [Cyanobium sp. NS01]